MSIASQMERIGNNINNTYQVLVSAGAEMPAEANSDNLPATVQTIKAVLYGKAQTLTETQKSQARENISALSMDGISLGIASDGLIYIFVNGAPVGTGIPQGQSGDVFGYVDENNTIVLNGNLADGTYSVKYEMENGTVVNVGNMVLDSNVYYSVTSTLTNCTSNNSTKTVVEGGSYAATITAKDGYELKSLTVTMGGSPVSVSGGSISIANVTGNIVITAVAEEVKKETNFAEYNSTNTTDWSIWINNARAGSDGTYRSDTVSADYGTPAISNYIAVQDGDVIEFSNFYISNKNTVAYNASKTVLQAATPSGHSKITNFSHDSTGYNGQLTINGSDVAYIRIGGYVWDAFGTPVIKIKRNGEYL